MLFQKPKHSSAGMAECFAAKNFLKMIYCIIVSPNGSSALDTVHREHGKIVPTVAIKLGAFLHLAIKHSVVDNLSRISNGKASCVHEQGLFQENQPLRRHHLRISNENIQ